MKNRTLLLAATAAALAAPMAQLALISPQGANAQQLQFRLLGGGPAPEGGIGSALGSIADASGDGAGFRKPRYTNFNGHSVAHGKRMARKRRNQLRAKGHHRQAVR